jgi:hypothetical protein
VGFEVSETGDDVEAGAGERLMMIWVVTLRR